MSKLIQDEFHLAEKQYKYLMKGIPGDASIVAIISSALEWIRPKKHVSFPDTFCFGDFYFLKLVC